jgi:hypothetical protein
MKSIIQKIVPALILILIEALVWIVGLRHSPELLKILVWINYIALALFHLLFLSLIFVFLLSLVRYFIGFLQKKSEAEKDTRRV